MEVWNAELAKLSTRVQNLELLGTLTESVEEGPEMVAELGLLF